MASRLKVGFFYCQQDLYFYDSKCICICIIFSPHPNPMSLPSNKAQYSKMRVMVVPILALAGVEPTAAIHPSLMSPGQYRLDKLPVSPNWFIQTRHQAMWTQALKQTIFQVLVLCLFQLDILFRWAQMQALHSLIDQVNS